MKKIGLFPLLIITGLFLAGCSSDSNSSSAPAEKEAQTSQAETNKEQADSEKSQFYFTANEGGSISKIDASSNEVVKTIEVDGSVHNVQVSLDGEILGATVVPSMNHSGSNGEESMEMLGQALFFDIDTNELIKSVEVGQHPAHIAFTEDAKYVLVTNNEDNNVSVIDMQDYSLIKTINTGKGPHGFRISADSQKAYIANMGEDSVSVLNLETMKEEKRITVGKAPVTTGVTSDGKTLVATLNGENKLAIVDLKNGKVEKVAVDNGPAQVYIDGNNQLAYVANQGTEDNPSHSVSVIDLASKKVKEEIETGKGSHGVVTSSDKNRLYVTNMYENTVSVIDTEQNIVLDTFEVGEIPNGISIMK